MMAVSTAATVTPYEAAQEIRTTLRQAVETGSDDYWARKTTALIEVLKKEKNAQRIVARLPELETYLRSEREAPPLDYVAIQRLYELSQHLPTQPNLPGATKAENTLRAIQALLKNLNLKEDGSNG
jgi:hypothetical protein